ncbi:MAG: hypothetical protein ACK5Q5_22465 [Planctomycetaceae bacterium]
MREALLLCLLLVGCGCSRISLPAPEPPAPTPVVPDPAPVPQPDPEPTPIKPAPQPPAPVVVETEADYWDAIAELVESGDIDSTETVLNLAERLKQAGHLTDLSRLEEWAPPHPMVRIDDVVRSAVADKIRGN